VDVICDVLVARATLSSSQTCPSTVFLDASLCTFSLWDDAWWWMIVGLLLVIISFLFLPAFLSLLEMVHVCPLIFRFINFSPYIFIVYFSPWFYYKSFKCFQFSHWITIFHILFFPIQSVFIYVSIILYWF